MFDNDVSTYGILNTQTKELFKFDDYEQAIRGFFHLILDDMKGYSFPEEWYLVLIKGNLIVQLEQLTLNKQSKIVEIDNTYTVHNGRH